MKSKKMPKRRRRREYGPSYFAEKMSGMGAALRKIAAEEKAMKGPLATERVQ